MFGRRGTGFSGWSKSKIDLDAKLASLGVKMLPGGCMICGALSRQGCMTLALSLS